MVQEFASAASLDIVVRRAPRCQALLPWLTEAELQREQGERWGCSLAPAADDSGSMLVSAIEAGVTSVSYYTILKSCPANIIS